MKVGDIIPYEPDKFLRGCPFCGAAISDKELGKSIITGNRVTGYQCGFAGSFVDPKARAQACVDVVCPNVPPEQLKERHKCHCSRRQLLVFGCNCGGV
jgi:hypothetical protein